MSHYRRIHRGDKTFKVPCVFSDCVHPKKFFTEDGLRKHLKHRHSRLQPFYELHDAHNNDQLPTINERDNNQMELATQLQIQPSCDGPQTNS